MTKSKVEKLNVLAETKYLNLYEVEYKNKLGEDRTWSIASRKKENNVKKRYFQEYEDTIDAVIIIAEHVELNKLVLVKQFRVPINDFVYELPAGLVDGNESIETSVRRELKEETGLELIEIDYDNSKMHTYISVGMTDESVALVRCTCRGSISKEFLEPDEELEAVLIDRKRGKELIDGDENIDIKALLAIQNYIIKE